MTAVELLPVHQFVHEKHLIDKGLRNYWGYHSYGFFAPHNEYAADQDPIRPVREFKGMVKAAPRGGSRGDSRRGLQPHRRRQPARPDVVVQGLDNTVYYRPPAEISAITSITPGPATR